jgi:predicted ATP-grasp superfamily ATP-dependent carboligase
MLPSEETARRPHAIVIGLDSLNGIQAVRILARHQIPIVAIAKDPRHYGCRTKLCERILFADTSTEAFIRTLEGLGPTLAQKAVLFPCTDMNVLLISRHRHRLEPWYHVVLPPSDVVEMLMNKVTLSKFALENGFSIPRTRFLNSQADATLAAAELTFPCVLKPPMSAIPAWEQNSKLKAYKLAAPAELAEVYASTRDWADQVLVQEWVEGPDANLYSCNCYLDAQSQPLATFVARKLRQWPPVTGESSLGEECRDDTVLRESIRLLQRAGHRGLGYVEIKRDERSGAYFILEPNVGRPTGRSSIAEAGGVELLYTAYCDTVGLPLPRNRQQKYQGVKWISLRRDLQSAVYHWRNRNLTLQEWWTSVRGQKTYALLARGDLGPFVGDLQRSVRLYLSPEERKKRDFRNL